MRGEVCFPSSTREFALWLVDTVRLEFTRESDDGAVQCLFLDIRKLIETEWTEERNRIEYEKWALLFGQAKLLLNDAEKAEQLEREFTDIDLQTQVNLACEQITRLLQKHVQWKEFLLQTASILLEAKQRVATSPNSVRILQWIQANPLSLAFNYLACDMFERFERERGIPDSNFQQAWLALVKLKSPVSAFALYEREQKRESALALAMLATSVDFVKVKTAITNQVYGDKSLGNMFALFFERHSEEFAARRKLAIALFNEFSLRDITTLQDVKMFAADMLSAWVSQWQLPQIVGEREGIAYSCVDMQLSSFHIDSENFTISMQMPTVDSLQCAKPFVVVEINDITATVSSLRYSIKQGYFPFLSVEGEAECHISRVSLRCELQLIRREEDDVLQLRLSHCDVTIGSVQVDFVQSKEMWLMNLVKEMMSKALQMRMQAFLQDEVDKVLTDALNRFNFAYAAQVHPMLLTFVDMDVEKIPTLERVMSMQAPALLDRNDLYSVRFQGNADDGRLGLVLIQRDNRVVIDAFEENNEGKLRLGDQIVGVNGTDVTLLALDRIRNRIKRAKRPVMLTFAPAAAMQQQQEDNITAVHVKIFTFKEDKLYMSIKPRQPHESDVSAVVSGFYPTPTGGPGPAELAGVPVGWILSAVNGANMLTHTFKETMGLFATLQTRPVQLTFCRNPDLHVELMEPALGVSLITLPDATVVVTGFDLLHSDMETELVGLTCGDQVVRVGNVNVISHTFDQVVDLLRARITTAKRGNEVEVEFSSGVSAKFPCGQPLGMVFYNSDSKCLFKSFQAYQGPLQRLAHGGNVRPGHSIVSINDVRIISSEQAKNMLEHPASFPLRISFRNLEAFAAGGGWTQ